MYFFYFKSVALIVAYVEQDVNFMEQSRLGLNNWKVNLKICQKISKRLFCSQDGMG